LRAVICIGSRIGSIDRIIVDDNSDDGRSVRALQAAWGRVSGLEA